MTIQENRIALVAIAKHHASADMLVAGTYGRQNGHFRACSVGCFAHDIEPTAREDDMHLIIAEFAGVPEWLVRWQDTVFEGLPQSDRAGFHVGLAERIAMLPESLDFDRILHETAIARMDRLIVLQEAATPQQPYHAEVIAALRQVRAYHGNPSKSARSAAARSAWSAEYQSERDAMFAVLERLAACSS